MYIPPTACPWNCRWSAGNWCSGCRRTASRVRCSSSCWSHLECVVLAAQSPAWSICCRSRMHRACIIYEDTNVPSAAIVLYKTFYVQSRLSGYCLLFAFWDRRDKSDFYSFRPCFIGVVDSRYKTPTGWVKKSRPPRSFIDIFASAQSLCIKFCTFIGNIYPRTCTDFRSFIVTFSEMALILLWAPIIFMVSSFHCSAISVLCKNDRVPPYRKWCYCFRHQMFNVM